jgi:hypothetical protein
MGVLIIRSVQEAIAGSWLDDAGLLWADGVEPADSSLHELQGGNRIWYVDFDAGANGDGSSGSPFNTLATLNNGAASGYAPGDHWWLTGTADRTNVNHRILVTDPDVLGSTTNPLVIRSWKGQSRVVFNGNYTHVTCATVQMDGADQPNKGVVIINIESQRSYQSCGIYVGEDSGGNIGFVRIISCYAHHNYALNGGPNDTYGGIRVCATDITCDIEVRNCEVHDNNRASEGGSVQESNNIGGISLLSEIGGEGSAVKFYSNRIYNECHAIRHKHCGRVLFESYWNSISDSLVGHFIRATTMNEVRHSLVVGCSSVIHISPELQGSQGNQLRTIDAHHLTIVDTDKILSCADTFSFADLTGFDAIIYYYPGRTGVLGDWGEASGQNFPIAGATVTNSCLRTGATSTYWTDRGTVKNKAAFDAYFGATNIDDDPLFTNYAGGDYTLQVGSPATGMGAF